MEKVYSSILLLLNEAGIDFLTMEHEASHTSEESARIRGDKLSSGAKAIVYKVQDEYNLFVLAADRKMSPKKIKDYFKSIGKKAKKTRFATSEELLEMTELVPGSVPPFGRPILDFDLYVDPTLLENNRISFNAGTLTNSINMSLEDYINISKPVVFDFEED